MHEMLLIQLAHGCLWMLAFAITYRDHESDHCRPVKQAASADKVRWTPTVRQPEPLFKV